MSNSSNRSVLAYCLEAFEVAEDTIKSVTGSYDGFLTVAYVIYIVAMVFGGLGNLSVICIIMFNRRMRGDDRNFLILMLAVSDFFMCAVGIPSNLFQLSHFLWYYGSTSCRLLNSVNAFFVFLSTCSVTAISLDRYFLIIFPTNSRLHSYVFGASLTAACGLSCFLAIPSFVAVDIGTLFAPETSINIKLECNAEYPICQETWDAIPKTWLRVYGCAMFICQYFFPLCSLIMLNLSLSFRLDRQLDKFRPTSQNRDSENVHVNVVVDRQTTAMILRNRQVRRMVIAIVTTFAIVWLPWNIFNQLTAFNFDLVHDKMNIFSFCHSLAMCSACVNPIIYGVMNKNFKREFHGMYVQVMSKLRSNKSVKSSPTLRVDPKGLEEMEPMVNQPAEPEVRHSLKLSRTIEFNQINNEDAQSAML